ncbi:hypothetical protein ACWD8I_21900 [Micromonospora arida]|uniref:hypothetical protein n=1 Tax=Micromonospora arida TaxID=2203715 RepID=UPI0033C81312
MMRAVRMLAGGLLVALGAGGIAVAAALLSRESLDRAEKWVSLIGMPLSLLIGVAGLVLALRSSGPRASRTGDAEAMGPGSRAVTGVAGPSGVAGRTGKARATGGGTASTGVDEM